MIYEEAKVYFDGSHYIAIPHTTRPNLKRNIKCEETITIVESEEGVEILDNTPSLSSSENLNKNEKLSKNYEKTVKNSEKIVNNVKILTKKEIFNGLYQQFIDLKKSERKKKIIEKMKIYFKNEEMCISFVEKNFERKERNLICRRIRMCRKANLANFNYFCTFTYDNNKHTEVTFKKKLRTCFRHLCERRNWRYMGIWERAPKTNRLHFHGLFSIPKNGIPGEIVEVRDYSTQFHKMQTTFQSSYFNERFGRSDFKEIDENERRLGNALAYLMKYIEKTGEKIVYSKGLPQYFISDILESDVVCRIGEEKMTKNGHSYVPKLLLYDDFRCWDEGVFIGNVSEETISQMRKSN